MLRVTQQAKSTQACGQPAWRRGSEMNGRPGQRVPEQGGASVHVTVCMIHARLPLLQINCGVPRHLAPSRPGHSGKSEPRLTRADQQRKEIKSSAHPLPSSGSPSPHSINRCPSSSNQHTHSSPSGSPAQAQTQKHSLGHFCAQTQEAALPVLGGGPCSLNAPPHYKGETQMSPPCSPAPAPKHGEGGPQRVYPTSG